MMVRSVDILCFLSSWLHARKIAGLFSQVKTRILHWVKPEPLSTLCLVQDCMVFFQWHRPLKEDESSRSFWWVTWPIWLMMDSTSFYQTWTLNQAPITNGRPPKNTVSITRPLNINNGQRTQHSQSVLKSFALNPWRKKSYISSRDTTRRVRRSRLWETWCSRNWTSGVFWIASLNWTSRLWGNSCREDREMRPPSSNNRWLKPCWDRWGGKSGCIDIQTRKASRGILEPRPGRTLTWDLLTTNLSGWNGKIRATEGLRRRLKLHFPL